MDHRRPEEHGLEGGRIEDTLVGNEIREKKVSNKKDDANFQRICDKSNFGTAMLNAAENTSQMEHDTLFYEIWSINQKMSS